jgi:hypothetical protein
MHWLFTFALTHWEAFTAVVGGFFGATLGAFLTGYLGEKGKQIATKKDIADVLDELRKVTTETESIKAQISSDAWLKQTIWVQKREAYAALLASLAELSERFMALSAPMASLETENPMPESKEHGDRIKDISGKRASALDALLKTSRLFGEAALFDPEILMEQGRFGRESGLDAAIGDKAKSADVVSFAVGIMKFNRSVLLHMRKELGIT